MASPPLTGEFHINACLQLIIQDIFHLCEANLDFSLCDSIVSDSE